MKKLTLVIAMLLTAAVAFGQGKGLVMNEKGFHAEGALGYIDKGAFLNVSAGISGLSGPKMLAMRTICGLGIQRNGAGGGL